tara:strand:- start:1486 stop:1866 length:381 start_codon:yes stop_codon:yes gene_type:complete
MSFFSKRTGVSPVNCITSNKTLVFVVEKGQAIKALGKNGENVKSMRSAFNKDIKVFERGENIDETVQNFLYPIKLNSIRVLRRVLSILLDNPEERRILLANGRKQLKILRTVLSQYHPEIRDVQVL